MRQRRLPGYVTEARTVCFDDYWKATIRVKVFTGNIVGSQLKQDLHLQSVQ